METIRMIGGAMMILSGVGIVGCLPAPSMTNGRASFDESMLVSIPLAGLFFLTLVLTIVAELFFFKAKKNAAQLLG